jgi:hypothetical protein
MMYEESSLLGRQIQDKHTKLGLLPRLEISTSDRSIV